MAIKVINQLTDCKTTVIVKRKFSITFIDPLLKKKRVWNVNVRYTNGKPSSFIQAFFFLDGIYRKEIGDSWHTMNVESDDSYKIITGAAAAKRKALVDRRHAKCKKVWQALDAAMAKAIQKMEKSRR